MIKHNKIRNILAVSIVAAITLLAVTLYLKLPDMRKKAVSVARLPHNVDISMRTVTYSETREGARKWMLEAQQADVAQKDNQIFLTMPHFILYLKRKPGTLTLTAGKAVYHVKSRDITLTEKVVATSDDGMSVETENIFYDAAHSLLSSADHVKISNRNATVEGEGMEIHTVNGTVKLLRNVRATLQPGRK